MVFYLRTAFRNIRHSKIKSILVVFLCVCMITLLNLYWNNILTNREQLVELSKAMPIYCRISNQSGSMESGIFISDKIVIGLIESDYVEKQRFVARLETTELSIISTNTIDSIQGLTLDDIELADNISIDFLNSSIKFCLVNNEIMEQRNWEIGDTITLELLYENYLNQSEIVLEPLTQDSFRIVGSINEISPNIILPFEATREIFHKQGRDFYADSANFYVKDPLKLNQFKDEMKELGLISISPDDKGSYKGNSLFVEDAIFISTANRLVQVMNGYLAFLPVLIVAVVFIGYFISYLLIYARKKDFSIMRLIGFSKSQAFMVLFLELLLLVLSGVLVQTIFSVIYISQNMLSIVITNLFFVLNFLFGGIISLLLLGNKKVMEDLSQND